jgi:hypothetical protein
VADESAVAGGQMGVRFDELEDGLTDIFARDRIVQDGGPLEVVTVARMLLGSEARMASAASPVVMVRGS